MHDNQYYSKTNSEAFFKKYRADIERLSEVITKQYKQLHHLDDMIYDRTIDKLMKYLDKEDQSIEGTTDRILSFIRKTIVFACLELLRLRYATVEWIHQESFPEPASRHATPETEFLKNDLINRIWQVIKELPEEQQQLLRLLYASDYTTEEIAEELTITPNTLYQRNFIIFEKIIRTLEASAYFKVEDKTDQKIIRQLLICVFKKWLTYE